MIRDVPSSDLPAATIPTIAKGRRDRTLARPNVKTNASSRPLKCQHVCRYFSTPSNRYVSNHATTLFDIGTSTVSRVCSDQIPKAKHWTVNIEGKGEVKS